MTKNCRTVRDLLINNRAHTAGPETEKLPDWVSAHLASCEACQDFFTHYPAFTVALRNELTKAITPLPAPDYSFLNDSSAIQSEEKERSAPEKNSYPHLLPWAAVLVVLVLGAVLGYFGFSAAAPQNLVTEDSKLFINRLYASSPMHYSLASVLPEEGSDPEAILPDEWFQVTNLDSGFPF